ncbi:hypothetical protein RDWZM_006380 [Blomia tropicalis]|uniref:Uncharacterized protein n=1 Tax=Blomia tropicalis TaxID=40697 RepID=A0A9Q0RLQ1_BLOTA|nr:hypothetical protein RDWZM_006380 [Blomia tropicalis]
MDFKVDFYMRHIWIDNRLAFPIKYNISRINFGEEFTKNIWLPDSSFNNGKDVSVQKIMTEASTTHLHVYSTGELYHSTRISLLAQCRMDLTFFPLDQQKCSIEICSYSFTDLDVIYHWADGIAVEISPTIFLPTFELIGYSTLKFNDVYVSGNYTRLQVDFYLSRSVGYYISQIYVPAFMIVTISWVPFWLDRDDNHARVALGVTTVLTMTTLITNTNLDFPKISHLKAIDIYLFISFIMVFLSLLEYATVGYYETRQEIKRRKQELDSNTKSKQKFRTIK